MDLNALLYHHQRALMDLAGGADSAAREWAGVRADHYAGQLVRLRQRMGVPVRTFDRHANSC